MAMVETMHEYLSRKYSREIGELERVILSPAMRKRISPFFYDYFKSTVTNEKELREYFLASVVISRELSMKGKRILDVGCGLGLRLICLALAGAREAIGIDISEVMTKEFRTLLREFPRLKIEVVKGDFLTADFPPDSFDVVIVQEAISHIRDTHLLLDKARRVLHPGGTLYVSDCNNDLYLPSRIRNRRLWRESESVPISERESRYWREFDKLNSFQGRMKIIRRRYPRLDEKTLVLIARKTQGMYGEEITKATEEFMTTGKISHKVSFRYRNPFTGEFPELGINPLRLARDMKRRGFKCTFLQSINVPLGVCSLTSFYSKDLQRRATVAGGTHLTLRDLSATLLLFLGSFFRVVGVRNSPATLRLFFSPCFRLAGVKD
jgi:SAM-dependent methyltransferase